MGRQVALHLGIHKTATTHFQSRMSASKSLLELKGIKYIELGKLRKILTSQFSRMSAYDIKSLFDQFGGHKRVIISDENLVGGIAQPRGPGFYNNTFIKVNKLIKAFGADSVDVVIVFRDYGDYMISRYSESLKHCEYCSFDEYYKNLNLNKNLLEIIVKDILKAGVKELKVFDFNDVIKSPNVFFDTMMGERVELLEAKRSNNVVREKMSNEMHDIVCLTHKMFQGDMSQRVMKLLDSGEKRSLSNDFMPISYSEKKELSQKYKIDFEAISKLDNVRVFGG